MDATEIEAMRARIREAPDAVDAVVDEMVRLLGERDEARAEVRRLTVASAAVTTERDDAVARAESAESAFADVQVQWRAEVARLRAEHAAALDAARREGAEGMQQRCDDALDSLERHYRATERDVKAHVEERGAAWERGAAIENAHDAIRALPLDAPGGAS